MSGHPVVSVITGARRPRWRGHIHTWAFVLTVPGVIALLVLARDPTARFASAVFGLSLLAVYGVSAAYHRLARSDRAQRLMRRVDHAMIFVLIAGTYTPVCLLTLPGRWRTSLLAAVWGLTALGMAVKAWGTGWLMRASNSLYLIIGWLAVVALPVMLPVLSPAVLAFMIVGGVVYTIGAVLFYCRQPDLHPEVFGYHEVWHAMTVLAGASHFAMVALVVG